MDLLTYSLATAIVVMGAYVAVATHYLSRKFHLYVNLDVVSLYTKATPPIFGVLNGLRQQEILMRHAARRHGITLPVEGVKVEHADDCEAHVKFWKEVIKKHHPTNKEFLKRLHEHQGMLTYATTYVRRRITVCGQDIPGS